MTQTHQILIRCSAPSHAGRVSKIMTAGYIGLGPEEREAWPGRRGWWDFNAVNLIRRGDQAVTAVFDDDAFSHSSDRGHDEWMDAETKVPRRNIKLRCRLCGLDATASLARLEPLLDRLRIAGIEEVELSVLAANLG